MVLSDLQRIRISIENVSWSNCANRANSASTTFRIVGMGHRHPGIPSQSELARHVTQHRVVARAQVKLAARAVPVPIAFINRVEHALRRSRLTRSAASALRR